MNGNANLNANNLTAQNVQDWRNKLGIGGAITSIDGLAGGTLTSTLVMTGGSASDKPNIRLDNSANGQIIDNSNYTIFGFRNNETNNLYVGRNAYGLKLRGSGTRPQFNGNDIALRSETMMPSDSWTNYATTPTANTELLTAPSNGYAYMRYRYTGSGTFSVNLTTSTGNFLANQYLEYTNGAYINFVFAMKKGQKLKIENATGTYSWGATMFVSVSGT